MNFIKKANPPFYHATTAGNLTEIETNQLEKVSSDLRHLYDQKSPG